MAEDFLSRMRRRSAEERQAAAAEANRGRRDAHERLADQYDTVIKSYELLPEGRASNAMPKPATE